MLKIGDFSKLGYVTVKTLRHYAQIGLLRPAWIDRFTGYRYYSLRQLARLNRILALKDLGFSLEQITQLIDENVPVDQLRGMLRIKQAELKNRVQSELVCLAQVEARLHQIEQEGQTPGYEVAVKRVGEQRVAAMHSVVTEAEGLVMCCSQMRSELANWLEGSQIKGVGPWFIINNSLEYIEGDIEVELAVVVEGKITNRSSLKPDARVSLKTLPPVENMASVIHTNGNKNLLQAYTALYAWIERSGYHISGSARELYLDDIEGNSTVCQMVEVQVPVERFTLPKRSISFRSDKEESEMEPKFVNKPAFLLVGMKYVGKNQNQEIHEMWEHFTPRVKEIKNIVWDASYGVCAMVEGLEDGVFEYVAGFEVTGVEDLPEGMVVRMISEQKYAVFEHWGSLEKLHDTYEYIHQVWLPKSGNQIGSGPELEVYDKSFKDFQPDSVFYIYVPVE